MNKVDLNRDIVVGTVLAGVSVFYLVAAVQLPGESFRPGPGFLPIVLGTALLFTSISFIREGRKAQLGARLTPNDAPSFAVPRTSVNVRTWHTSTQVVFLTIAYIPAFHLLGFFISTASYVGVLAVVFGTQRRSVVIALAIIVPAVLFALFSLGLGVAFPLIPGQ